MILTPTSQTFARYITRPMPATENGAASRARLFLLDYGAGNVRSLANSLTELGFTYEWIESAQDFDKADVCMLSQLMHSSPPRSLK